jgi:predicted dehydrogenase
MHIPVLLAVADVSIVWITDRDEAKARSVARGYRLPMTPLPADLQDLPPADVVLITVPFGHREPIYEALKNRSCAVYVEKPFSRSLSHHKRICSYFDDHRLGCGFQRRSWGPNLWMKDLIESEVLGELRSVAFGLGNPGMVTGGGFSSDVAAAGGGLLFEVGIHGIDSALFVTGATDVRVSRCKMTLTDQLDVHTEGTALVTLPGARQVPLDFTVSCLKETTNELEFRFDRARVSYSLFSEEGIGLRSIKNNYGIKIQPQLLAGPMTSFQTFYSHWERFLTGYRSGIKNWTAAVNCLLTTVAMEEIYGNAEREEL